MSKIRIKEPSKFIVQVKKCGTDTCGMVYKGQFEHKNPFILGMKVVDLMAGHFAQKGNESMYNYELALHLLAGLEFDEKLLVGHINQVRDGLVKELAKEVQELDKGVKR